MLNAGKNAAAINLQRVYFIFQNPIDILHKQKFKSENLFLAVGVEVFPRFPVNYTLLLAK